MTTQQIIELTDQYIMHTYGRLPLAFVKGQGATLWDAEGNEYLDFVAGIAVLGPGHSHPTIVEAIRRQAAEITHTSNLYHIPQQAELAQRLSQLSFGGKAFFCNSGAEANEAAIKLARKWASIHRPDVAPQDRTILTALKSFHGRTLTTLTATGQDKYHQGFDPLAPGFRYFEFGDIAALSASMTDDVCAVMLEPIQAEGGMNTPADGFLRDVRSLCDTSRCLMILDEVQTGLGRTGEWFGYMHEGVAPDIMTLAKALGSGYPIGCCLAKAEIADTFQPGDHASTFGGSHLACTVALATLDVIEAEGLLQNAKAMGDLLEQELAPDKHTSIVEMRGKGLLRAVRFQPGAVDAQGVQNTCRDLGLIVNAMGADRLRLAPPLNVTSEEIKQAAAIVLQAIDAQ
jgi:acetylornithine/N-succinyldiaminopimelate aminotransferase